MSGWKWVTLVTAEDVRLASRAIADALTGCGSSSGVQQGSPLFEWVTEGRQTATDRARKTNPNMVPYSACGDLVGTNLVCLGCRDERLVNTNKDGGTHLWSVGKNLSMLIGGISNLWIPHTSSSPYPQEGDVVIVDPSQPHTFVVDQIDCQEGGMITSFEYGKWDTVRGVHGRKCYGTIDWRGGKMHVITEDQPPKVRQLMGHISILAVPRDAPALVPSTCTAGVEISCDFEDDYFGTGNSGLQNIPDWGF